MTLRFAVHLAFALVSVPAVALAGPAHGTKEQEDACQADVFKVCNDAVPDEEKIIACLNQNLHKLSYKCQIMMEPDPAKRSHIYPGL